MTPQEVGNARALIRAVKHTIPKVENEIKVLNNMVDQIDELLEKIQEEKYFK